MKRKTHPARGQVRDVYKSNEERDHAMRLSVLKRADRILDFYYEPFRFRLANGKWYKEDFLVLHLDFSLEMQQVKGHHANVRDAITRWAVASDRFAFYRWSFWRYAGGAPEVTAYYDDDVSFLWSVYGLDVAAGCPAAEKRRLKRGR